MKQECSPTALHSFQFGKVFGKAKSYFMVPWLFFVFSLMRSLLKSTDSKPEEVRDHMK